MEDKKVTPYRTSSGLEIGKFYIPPEKKQSQNFDDQLLQEALLNTKQEIKTDKMGEIWKKFLMFISK